MLYQSPSNHVNIHMTRAERKVVERSGEHTRFTRDHQNNRIKSLHDIVAPVHIFNTSGRTASRSSLCNHLGSRRHRGRDMLGKAAHQRHDSLSSKATCLDLRHHTWNHSIQSGTGTLQLSSRRHDHRSQERRHRAQFRNAYRSTRLHINRHPWSWVLRVLLLAEDKLLEAAGSRRTPGAEETNGNEGCLYDAAHHSRCGHDLLQFGNWDLANPPRTGSPDRNSTHHGHHSYGLQRAPRVDTIYRCSPDCTGMTRPCLVHCGRPGRTCHANLPDTESFRSFSCCSLAQISTRQSSRSNLVARTTVYLRRGTGPKCRHLAALGVELAELRTNIQPGGFENWPATLVELDEKLSTLECCAGIWQIASCGVLQGSPVPCAGRNTARCLNCHRLPADIVVSRHTGRRAYCLLQRAHPRTSIDDSCSLQ